VLAFGAVEIYAQRGEYQLVVELPSRAGSARSSSPSSSSRSASAVKGCSMPRASAPCRAFRARSAS